MQMIHRLWQVWGGVNVSERAVTLSRLLVLLWWMLSFPLREWVGRQPGIKNELLATWARVNPGRTEVPVLLDGHTSKQRGQVADGSIQSFHCAIITAARLLMAPEA